MNEKVVLGYIENPERINVEIELEEGLVLEYGWNDIQQNGDRKKVTHLIKRRGQKCASVD